MAISGFYVAIDRTPEAIEQMKELVDTALEACGVQAVAHAVTNITANGTVDTGLLRNSITYAMAGEAPHKGTYHGENQSKYSSTKAVPIGRYSGTAPANQGGQHTVYIGTNVYYAPYVELGHKTRGGGRVSPQPYLKPALEENVSEYKKIIQETLSGK